MTGALHPTLFGLEHDQCTVCVHVSIITNDNGWILCKVMYGGRLAQLGHSDRPSLRMLAARVHRDVVIIHRDGSYE